MCRELSRAQKICASSRIVDIYTNHFFPLPRILWGGVVLVVLGGLFLAGCGPCSHLPVSRYQFPLYSRIISDSSSDVGVVAQRVHIQNYFLQTPLSIPYWYVDTRCIENGQSAITKRKYTRYTNAEHYQIENVGIHPLFLLVDYIEPSGTLETGTERIDDTLHFPYDRLIEIFRSLEGVPEESDRYYHWYHNTHFFHVQNGYVFYLSEESYPAPDFTRLAEALNAYHQKYCPEVSGTGISDNTADSGYYTFLDQCEGVIVIKPGETKPFHYNGYGSPRE